MTSILARVDAAAQPVVFIADTLKDGKIQAWDTRGGARYVGIDYYQSTRPVSDADADSLRKQYAKATGQPAESVFMRQRLPRVYRDRPNLITAHVDQRSKSEAAKERVEQEIAATRAGAVTITLDVAPQYVDAMRQFEDPRTAALILKIAETLKAAL